jgi:drug/metabolite transporter (DMT)-like permease
VPNQLDTWLAFWYLVLIGTVAVFVLFLFVLRRWTASGTSYVFVLTPFVTVAVGVWLAGETVTWTFLLGGALVLVGVYIGALAPSGTPTLNSGLGAAREVDPARSLKDSAQT